MATRSALSLFFQLAIFSLALILCTAHPRGPAIECSPRTFNCTSYNAANRSTYPACIPASERCDCVINCAGASDEKNCGHVFINITDTDQALGTITSLGYPQLEFPMHCTYNISTGKAGRYIKMVFNDFDLPRPKLAVACEDSYVTFENVDYGGNAGRRLPIIGQHGEKIGMGYCGQWKPPLLKSHTLDPASDNGTTSIPHSWLVLTVNINIAQSEDRKIKRGFMATWYSVVDSFPPNLVPSRGETWPEVVSPEVKKEKKKDEADSAFIASVVILSLLVSGVALYGMCRWCLADKILQWKVNRLERMRNENLEAPNDDVTVSIRERAPTHQARRRNGNERSPINPPTPADSAFQYT